MKMEVQTEKIGFATPNVNGLQNPIKRNNIFKHFKNTNIYIICLQETHIVPKHFELIKSEWNGPLHWNLGTSNSGGVGIILNSHKKFEVLQTLQDQVGRTLILKLKYNIQTFQVCTIYAPDKPNLREHFFSELAKYLLPNIPLNMAEDPTLDRQGPTILPQHTKGLTALTELKDQFKLFDCWRQNNPKQRQYTWPTKLSNVQSRLDRIYVPTDLNHQIIHQDFMPTVWSDHKYNSTHIFLMKQETRGANNWKLNTDILTEPAYQEHIKTLINEHTLRRTDYPDILQWLDGLKNRTNHNQCSRTQKRAIISLLYKEGEREILNNWRPISLLCTDYKLITKTLANRLTPTLHHILHENQTCTVPTPTIYDNLYLIREIIHHTQLKSRHPAYLIALDIQKAFDSIDHQYLVQTLEKFGYGPTFINFITNSYTNITANVMNNGYLTSDIELQRGLRQGCPLSLILYCIVAETLANEIRANKKIQGYNAPGTHEAIKIS